MEEGREKYTEEVNQENEPLKAPTILNLHLAVPVVLVKLGKLSSSSQMLLRNALTKETRWETRTWLCSNMEF